MKVKVRLDTYKDMVDFCNIAESNGGNIVLTGSEGNTKCTVNAKSIIGVQYTMLWNEIWCESEQDISHSIRRFIVNE